MTLLHKSAPILEIKAEVGADGEPTGEFEALVAVFGNVDSGGDRILPKAFDRTLAEWRKSGDPIPVILSHQWNDPFAHIGIVRPEDAQQTDRGLQVKGTLDVGTNDVAKQVHRLMARRSLKEFSFGYRVFPGGQKKGKDGANELSSIDLAELGPTLKGLNPATELVDVKSALGLLEAPPDAADQRARAAELEREVEAERAGSRPPAPPDPEPFRCSKGHATTEPLPGQTLLPCGCVWETASERAKADAGLSVHEPLPDPEALRAKAAAVEAEERAREEAARVGDVPPAPPEPPAAEPELAPEPPDPAALAARARALEQAQAEADRRARLAAEAARIGDVPPPAPPEPAPQAPPAPPDPEALRARADAIERAARAEAERQRVGQEPPAPPEEPQAPPPGPEPKAEPPDATRQRRRADEVARRTRREADDARAGLGRHDASRPAPGEPKPKALVSNERDRLQAAVQERWADPATQTWAYVDDFDPAAGYAIVSVCSPSDQGYYRVDYVTGAGGEVTLAEQATEVVRTVGYAPAGASSAPSADELAARARVAERQAEADRAGSTPAPKGEPAPIAPALRHDCDAARATRLLDSKALADGTVLYVRAISAAEHAGVGDGLLKAVWSAAYVNALPDSAFLYVESGGEKDDEGKTIPRSLRHFPYRDADGNIDLPHLRNALARIPQSNLPQAVKDRLASMAQRIIDAQKADGTVRGKRSVDPLRAEADAVALEFASGGESLRQPKHTPTPPRRSEPELSLGELRERMRDEMLTAVSGGMA